MSLYPRLRLRAGDRDPRRYAGGHYAQQMARYLISAWRCWASIPAFWLALLLTLFSPYLGWFPVSGA